MYLGVFITNSLADTSNSKFFPLLKKLKRILSVYSTTVLYSDACNSCSHSTADLVQGLALQQTANTPPGLHISRGRGTGEGVPEVRGRVAEGSRSHGGQMDSGDGQADGGSRPERPGRGIDMEEGRKLKFMEEFVWETKEKGIAVIQAGSDKGVNQDCSGVGNRAKDRALGNTRGEGGWVGCE
ncbi:unnamed protein product [Pleuronectes platessa]|uniref:Uncharacterized protein n=1 Tax=Pleuronectes platessa TaxID=8262 RepID=A0A9N7VKB8_PLEPL|nr:unnamed protein product [Pleuronectes platessa]